MVGGGDPLALALNPAATRVVNGTSPPLGGDKPDQDTEQRRSLTLRHLRSYRNRCNFKKVGKLVAGL